jgi:hypothetical protein
MIEKQNRNRLSKEKSFMEDIQDESETKDILAQKR